MNLYEFAASRGVTVDEVVDGFIKNHDQEKWAYDQLAERPNGKWCENCGAPLRLVPIRHKNPIVIEFECPRNASIFSPDEELCPLVAVRIYENDR